MAMYRQGDVLLVTVDVMPSDEARPRPRDGGRLILARGEATGHAHAVSSPLAELLEEPEGDLLLRVHPGGPVELTHEQHGPIPLPAGVYRVIRQRQYSPGDPDDLAPVED